MRSDPLSITAKKVFSRSAFVLSRIKRESKRDRESIRQILNNEKLRIKLFGPVASSCCAFSSLCASLLQPRWKRELSQSREKLSFHAWVFVNAKKMNLKWLESQTIWKRVSVAYASKLGRSIGVTREGH